MTLLNFFLSINVIISVGFIGVFSSTVVSSVIWQYSLWPSLLPYFYFLSSTLLSSLLLWRYWSFIPRKQQTADGLSGWWFSLWDLWWCWVWHGSLVLWQQEKLLQHSSICLSFLMDSKDSFYLFFFVCLMEMYVNCGSNLSSAGNQEVSGLYWCHGVKCPPLYIPL